MSGFQTFTFKGYFIKYSIKETLYIFLAKKSGLLYLLESQSLQYLSESRALREFPSDFCENVPKNVYVFFIYEFIVEVITYKNYIILILIYPELIQNIKLIKK